MAQKLIDITGQKFGSLTVIRRLDTKDKWLCKCECGREHITYSSNLRNGRSKHCKECSKQAMRKDLTGKRFERLTALYMTKCEGHAYWMCKCDCGNYKEIAGASLSDGSTRSCGCLQREKQVK